MYIQFLILISNKIIMFQSVTFIFKKITNIEKTFKNYKVYREIILIKNCLNKTYIYFLVYNLISSKLSNSGSILPRRDLTT